jgi:hypothetical protein
VHVEWDKAVSLSGFCPWWWKVWVMVEWKVACVDFLVVRLLANDDQCIIW